MQKSYDSTTPKIVGGIIMSAVFLIAVYTLILTPNNPSKTAANSDVTTTQTVSTTNSSKSPAGSAKSNTTSSQSSAASTSSNSYKDGTYSVTARYRVPSGTNAVSVSLVLKDDTVSSVDVSNDYRDYESQYYVSNFDNNIKQKVEGKKLSSLSIGRVGGASLTSGAFAQALSSIADQAAI